MAPYLDAAECFPPTGETLAQIQNRVLPIGAMVNGVRVADDNTRVPLYLSTAGWATLNVRSGFRSASAGRSWRRSRTCSIRNYRFHGSGIDAPGITAYLSIGYRF